MFVIKYRKFFLGLSAFFMLASLVAIVGFGLNFGIDFTGGSIVEIEYAGERTDIAIVKDRLSKNDYFSGAFVQPTGEKGFIIRTGKLAEGDHAKLIATLNPKNDEVFTTV